MEAFLSGHQPTLAPSGGLANYPPYLIEAPREQERQFHEQAQAYEQQWMELSSQVVPLEATAQTEERDYFPLKARQLAADWEVRQRKVKLEKNAVQQLRLIQRLVGMPCVPLVRHLDAGAVLQ